jgi:hypothetical protein
MSESPGESPAQKSVTTIRPLIPRIVAVGVPVLAAVSLIIGGRHFGEALLLWGAVSLLFVGICALLAYMLTTGQFPPRMSKSGMDLPVDEIDETGKSLDLVQKTLVEIAERVERIEDHIDIDD